MTPVSGHCGLLGDSGLEVEKWSWGSQGNSPRTGQGRSMSPQVNDPETRQTGTDAGEGSPEGGRQVCFAISLLV